MDIEILRNFLFVCLVINLIIYIVSVIAIFIARNLICALISKTFGISEGDVQRGNLKYIANYKLLIIVFNFTPWLALIFMS